MQSIEFTGSLDSCPVCDMKSEGQITVPQRLRHLGRDQDGRLSIADRDLIREAADEIEYLRGRLAESSSSANYWMHEAENLKKSRHNA